MKYTPVLETDSIPHPACQNDLTLIAKKSCGLNAVCQEEGMPSVSDPTRLAAAVARGKL
jgi:hypothetical protein